MEVDGCKIRIAQLVAVDQDQAQDGVESTKRRREVDWREVRMGVVSDLDGQDKGYVGRVDHYPEVIGQLFSMAVEHGLSQKTLVVAVADGGKGIREELERLFPRIQIHLGPPSPERPFL